MTRSPPWTPARGSAPWWYQSPPLRSRQGLWASLKLRSALSPWPPCTKGRQSVFFTSWPHRILTHTRENLEIARPRLQSQAGTSGNRSFTLPTLSTASPLLAAWGPEPVFSGGCGREAGLGLIPFASFYFPKSRINHCSASLSEAQQNCESHV